MIAALLAAVAAAVTPVGVSEREWHLSSYAAVVRHGTFVMTSGEDVKDPGNVRNREAKSADPAQLVLGFLHTRGGGLGQVNVRMVSSCSGVPVLSNRMRLCFSRLRRAARWTSRHLRRLDSEFQPSGRR